MKKMSVKTLVAIGIGAAIFFVLGRFLSIPIFANTSINFQYAILGFFSALFGSFAGLLIGLIGHILIDLVAGYGVWWSWIIVSAFVGFFIGLIKNRIDIANKPFGKGQSVAFIITSAIANLVGFGVLAPILDILIYQEPANKVFTQGIIAGVSNTITTAFVGTILLFLYSKAIPKKGSLDKE